jgi:hypothetical protein
LSANTNIKAKATTGTIGGVLGSSNIVYRGGNNNTNNFLSIDGARYTLIALDSISRPKPLRTLNASNFGDTTYFNPLTGSYISVVEKAALSANQKSRLIPIGTVPLGSSDPGGSRFYLVRDIYPTFPNPNTNQAAIRLIHASPLAKPVWVRLKPVSTGSNITLGSNVNHVMSFPTFSPSVGNRTVTTTTVNFTLQTTSTNAYYIEVWPDNFATAPIFTTETAGTSYVFDPNKVYTVLVRGIIGGTGNRALGASVILHN